MPLYRFRSIEEMNRHEIPTPADLADRIAALWSRAAALGGLQSPRGLQKFRSLEEANQERELRTRDRIERLNRGRGGAAAGQPEPAGD